jgi:hypothetical protein
MFHDLRGLLTSIDEGLKTLRRRTHGRLTDELERFSRKPSGKAAP